MILSTKVSIGFYQIAEWLTCAPNMMIKTAFAWSSKTYRWHQNAFYCTHPHTDGMLYTNYFLNQYSILTEIHAPLFINEKLLSIPDMARHINNLITFGATTILRFIPLIWDIAGEFIPIIIFYYKCYKIITGCCLLICNSVQFIVRLSPMCRIAWEWQVPMAYCSPITKID